MEASSPFLYATTLAQLIVFAANTIPITASARFVHHKTSKNCASTTDGMDNRGSLLGIDMDNFFITANRQWLTPLFQSPGRTVAFPCPDLRPYCRC